MQRFSCFAMMLLVVASICLPFSESVGAELIDESVASVNGEPITVLELREALGYYGGGVAATEIPAEKKTEALERLIAGRLLSQEARKKGLDNTDEYRDLFRQSEKNRMITALFRRELSSNVKISREEIRAEAAKLRKSDKNLTQETANLQAKGAIWNRKAQKVQEDVIAAARKEASAALVEEAIGKIARGETVEDNVVLATAGGDYITYGELKQALENMGGGKPGGMDFSKNPDALRKFLDRDITGRALAAYARNLGIENSVWLASSRKENENSILSELLLSNQVLKEVKVTEKEIGDAYAKHSQMLVRDGKKIPLSEVREQIRSIVLGDKRKKAVDAYVAKSKKRAKISVQKKILPKV